MDVDMWASLPPDLLVEVFCRLEAADVLTCTGICKPWRLTVIGSAALCFRPRPDCFNPNLLIGFFHEQLKNKPPGVRLQLTPGLFNLAFATPTAGGINLALSGTPLSSRDGLLLLEVGDGDLCLYNTITGHRTLFPTASAFEPEAYVLVTGYDDLPDMGVRIVAVRWEYIPRTVTLIFRHQQISPTSGGAAVWGPAERSPEFTLNGLHTCILPGNEVVCGGAIHWLGGLRIYNQFNRRAGKVESFALALDMCTGRTWATKLPDQCRNGYFLDSLVLATSGDDRLSVVMDCRDSGDGDCIKVWVLIGGDEWVLERSVAAPAIVMRKPLWENGIVFCPRSGCVLLEVYGGDLVIEVATGLSNRIRYLKNRVPRHCDPGYGGYRFPYEMDWPTYLSRLIPF